MPREVCRERGDRSISYGRRGIVTNTGRHGFQGVGVPSLDAGAVGERTGGPPASHLAGTATSALGAVAAAQTAAAGTKQETASCCPLRMASVEEVHETRDRLP